METPNNNNNPIAIDNHGDLGQATMAREQLDIGLFQVGDCGRALATPETQTRPSMNEALREHIEGPSTTAASLPVDNAANFSIAPVAKAARKNPTRAKQHLLTGKDFFLAEACASECQGDPNLIPQGYVVECPDKKLNNGRFRIDWEHNTALPPAVTAAMLWTWCPSAKTFRGELDIPILKWENKASMEQKNRVNKKQKQSSTKLATVLGSMHTPPAVTRMFEARAGLRTEASTISSLSSHSLLTGTVLTDRRPQRPPSPSECKNVAKSNDDHSVGAASTRFTTQLDSDSNDGSELDEEDNVYKDLNDSDAKDEEKFRTHSEAEDLSLRARDHIVDYLKALEWKFELTTEADRPLQSHMPYCGGRWTWARCRSKCGMALRCVSVYRPVPNSTGASSVWNQHKRYLLSQNDDRDPQVAFWEDLRKEAQEWLREGDQLINGGDVNDEVCDPAVETFFSDLGMHNLIFEHHSPD